MSFNDAILYTQMGITIAVTILNLFFFFFFNYGCFDIVIIFMTALHPNVLKDLNNCYYLVLCASIRARF